MQPAGYHRSSWIIYAFWSLYHFYQLLQKTFDFNDSKITEFEMIDTENSSTAYVVIYKLITKWFWTRTEGWEFNYSHGADTSPTPLEAGRGISVETCGLNDIGFGLYTQFVIIYIYMYIYIMCYSCVLNNWNKLFLRDIYIRRVYVAVTVCWMIWYCYSSLLGLKFIFHLYSSGFLYHNMDIGTM